MLSNMVGMEPRKLDKPPVDMFSVVKSTSERIGPRLGRLALPGRKVIETPHYLGNTSRGVVPHITQDTFRRHTNINGVYVGLEDFIERAPRDIPPVLKFQPRDGASPLRSFIALPNDSLLVLGARRSPPIIAPAANPNTNTTVSVCTSVGFRSLKPEEYAQAAETLKPDVVVALGDIPYGRALGSKRIEKATDRSIQWVQDHIALRKSANTNGMQSRGRLFASMLPVSCEKQQFYVDLLSETVADEIAGLALHSLDTLDDLPDSLAQLPRIGFSSVDTPQEILQHASRGLDIVTVHFVSAATDAGIALHFTFPPPITEHGQAQAEFLPLGIDMWSSTHAIDIAPLAEKCDCYACTNHHRAYVQHLLMAKEMLGWTLLQIHNHWVVDSFFAGIRQSLERDTFQQDLCNFQRLYAKHLPEKTGKGPRVRGYEYKAEGPGEPKKNSAPFTMLDDGKEKLADAAPPDATSNDLHGSGFAEKE